jgi:hypothetical protein
MRVRIGVASVLFASAVGCGGGGQSTNTKIIQAPAPPAGGVQLISPTFTVPRGSEVFECMRIPYDSSQEVYVQSSKAWQMQGGHHSMLYYSTGTVTYKDEPHICDSTDMLDVRFIGVGTASGGGITMPDGVVLRIPAGVKVYAQSHYLNATEKDIVAQDAINLELVPKDKVQKIAGAWTEINTSLKVPAGETASVSVACSPPSDINVPWLIPHMHEFGQHFKVELTSGGSTRTLYDSDWMETLRDHFPFVDFDPHLALGSKDVIKTTCTWNNTSNQTLLWPREMCATFMVYYPSPDGALWACDHGGSNFRP